MVDVEKLVEKLFEIGSTIKDLDLEAAPMKMRVAQIEVKKTDLKGLACSLITTGWAKPETATPGAAESLPGAPRSGQEREAPPPPGGRKAGPGKRKKAYSSATWRSTPRVLTQKIWLPWEVRRVKNR